MCTTTLVLLCYSGFWLVNTELLTKNIFPNSLIAKSKTDTNPGYRSDHSCTTIYFSFAFSGTTPNLTLHNNTSVTSELNQTFIQNATNTLYSCIIPMNR